MKPGMGASAADEVASRVFARVVDGLRRPLTERESKALALACSMVAMAGPTELASLEEYTAQRAIELGQ